MTTPTQPQTRIRINVAVSTKGQKTWDCTVEMTDVPQETVLAESAKLVAELDRRYPKQEA